MAQNQSKAHKLVDAFFAPSQFISYDGSKYLKGSLGRVFACAVKPWHLYTLGIGTLFINQGGLEFALAGLAMTAPLSLFIAYMSSNRKMVIDTKGEHPPSQDANKLMQARKDLHIFSNMLMQYTFAGVACLSASAGYAAFTMDPGNLMLATQLDSEGSPYNVTPMFAAFYLWLGSDYWKAKQICDDNWRLIDDPPAQKTFSEKLSELMPKAKPVPA